MKVDLVFTLDPKIITSFEEAYMVKTILNFQTTSLLIRLSLDILVALNSDRYNVLCD